MKLIFKKINCNICNSNKFKVIRECNCSNISKKDIKNIFSWEALSISKKENLCGTIVKCKNCGLVYMNPQFKGVESLYTDSVDKFYIHTSPGRKSTFERDMKKINKLSKKGRLLDIASSTGLFMDVAKKHGWDVEGVELSKWAVNLAKKKNLKVHNKKLEDIKFKNDTFDVITMFGIIEHVPDPKSMLKEVRRILKKEGLVVITIPEVSFLWKKLLKKDYYILQHLTYFTPKTLELLLNKIGFKVIKFNHYFRYMKFREAIRWGRKSKYYKLLNFLFNNKFLGNIPFYNNGDEYIFYVKK